MCGVDVVAGMRCRTPDPRHVLCPARPPSVLLNGGAAAAVAGTGELTYLFSQHPEDENSFDNPRKVGGAGWSWDAVADT